EGTGIAGTLARAPKRHEELVPSANHPTKVRKESFLSMIPILGPLLDIAGKVIDRVIPDKAAAEKAKLEMAVQLQSQDFQLALEQTKVNAEEAKSASIFVSGWRPACGWIGAVGLGYAAIIEPVMRFVGTVFFQYGGIFPVLDTTITMQILFGILGLGAYRSFEKTRK